MNILLIISILLNLILGGYLGYQQLSSKPQSVSLFADVANSFTTQTIIIDGEVASINGTVIKVTDKQGSAHEFPITTNASIKKITTNKASTPTQVDGNLTEIVASTPVTLILANGPENKLTIVALTYYLK